MHYVHGVPEDNNRIEITSNRGVSDDIRGPVKEEITRTPLTQFGLSKLTERQQMMYLLGDKEQKEAIVAATTKKFLPTYRFNHEKQSITPPVAAAASPNTPLRIDKERIETQPNIGPNSRIAIVFRSGEQKSFKNDFGEPREALQPRPEREYCFGSNILGLEEGSFYTRTHLLEMCAHR